MKTYDITVTRDGKWWMIAVPAIDGLTQARRLTEITYMAVSLIAGVALSTERRVRHAPAGRLES